MTPSRRWLGWTGPGATFVLGLLCLVLVAVLAAGLWWDQRSAAVRPTAETPVTSVAARDEALEVAGPLTEQVLSYAFNDFDRRVAATSALLGDTYAEEYDARMAGLRDEVVGGKVVVKATATEVGVVSAAPDRAVALVFLDQVSATQGSPASRRDEVRVLVTLAPPAGSGGQWRVTRLDAF